MSTRPPRNLRFDLAALNTKLDRLKRKRRNQIVAYILGILGLGLLVFLIDLRSITSDSVSTYQLGGLLGLMGLIFFVAVVSISKRASNKPGAVEIALDEIGFELVYGDGTRVSTEWGDPLLSFDLVDTSRVNPSKLRVDTAFSIIVRGVQSLLPADAYRALLVEVHRQGLSDGLSSGSRLWYASDAIPEFHHIGPQSAR